MFRLSMCVCAYVCVNSCKSESFHRVLIFIINYVDIS